MTNQQILTFAASLGRIDPPEMNGDFNYAISYNLEEARRIAVNIRESIKDSQKVAEYKEKLQELQEEYASKDKNGKPVSKSIPLPTGGKIINYDIPSAKDPESDFNVKLNKLNEEYKSDLEKQNKRLERLKQENNEFEPIMINRSDIPKGLPREDMNLILPLIDKDE